MRMHLGRLIMTGSLLGTLVAPWLADWNASHLFSEQWSPHARFHGTVALFMLTGLSLFALWALWRRTADPVLAGLVGAAIPILYWGSFFVSVWIPGTALEDPGHPVARPLGIPVNVIAAGGQVLASLIGLVMHLKMGVPRGRGAEPRTLTTE